MKFLAWAVFIFDITYQFIQDLSYHCFVTLLDRFIDLIIALAKSAFSITDIRLFIIIGICNIIEKDVIFIDLIARGSFILLVELRKGWPLKMVMMSSVISLSTILYLHNQ